MKGNQLQCATGKPNENLYISNRFIENVEYANSFPLNMFVCSTKLIFQNDFKIVSATNHL